MWLKELPRAKLIRTPQFLKEWGRFPSVHSSKKEMVKQCLLIRGGDDRITPYDHTVKIAKIFENSLKVVIQDAGHCPHEEKPEEFQNILVDFLKKKNIGKGTNDLFI